MSPFLTITLLYHTQKEIGKTECNNKGDNQEWAKMDFVVLFRFSGWIHDETGNKISEKKSDEGKPWLKEGDADSGAKQPVTIPYPATF